MGENIINSLFLSQNPQIVVVALLTSIVGYIPRLFIAILVFLLGKMTANYLATVLGDLVAKINLKKIIDSFELGIHIPVATQQGLIHLVSLLTRYSVLYLTLIITFDILGLTAISLPLRSLATVFPKIISALFIIILGVIVAGIVEALVKKALLTIDPATARMSGKIASYVIVIFFVLMSLAEVGVASFFINTLFVGFVAAITLAFGLSVGLGSRDMVSQILTKLYQSKTKKK